MLTAISVPNTLKENQKALLSVIFLPAPSIKGFRALVFYLIFSSANLQTIFPYTVKGSNLSVRVLTFPHRPWITWLHPDMICYFRFTTFSVNGLSAKNI
jgi:hypothetical protein